MFALREKLLALLAWLAQPERLKLRLFLEGNLIGVLTGLVVAAFRYLLVCSEEILPRLYAWLAQAPWEFTALWLLALAGSGYIIYRILEAEPLTCCFAARRTVRATWFLAFAASARRAKATPNSSSPS